MQFEILTDKGTSISLVRYFMLNSKQFLIYSDANEGVDEQGHLTIHISEIRISDHIIADVVADEDWENLKNIIKAIVNSNKNNQPLPVEDLNYNNIDGVNVIGSKALKLMANYVDLLKLNQPMFEKNIVEDIIKPTEEVANVENSVSTDSVEGLNQNFDLNASDNSMFQNNDESGSSLNVAMPIEQPIPSFTVSNDNVNDDIDYKKLYEEQLELVKNLQNEISTYKNIIETVKNIINN